MNPAAITLVDIDDTLIQTRRKCPPGVELTPIGFGSDGNPVSFATPEQVRLIEWLATSTVFFAVTARSIDALIRTRLPFAGAIAAHGGVILAGGHEDLPAERRDWATHMAATLAPHQTKLAELARTIADSAANSGLPLRIRIVEEAGPPLYVVASHDDEAALHSLCAPIVAGLPPDWTAHVHGRVAALLPPGLGKAHAVAHILPELRAKWPGRPVIGIGDAVTDAGFMALCDFAMTPTGSPLAERLLK
jgi:hypothetical protein